MRYSFVNILIFSSLFVISCRVSEEGTKKQPLHFPATYNGSEDSSNFADIPYELFFKDETLKDLIDISLQNNPDLNIASQRIEVARANYKISKGANLPSLNFAANGGVRRFGEYTMDGVGNYDTQFSERLEREKHVPDPYPEYMLGLQSSWEVDLWGRLRNLKKASFARFMASESGKKLLETQLVAEVSNSYYELVGLDYELEVLRKNIDLQETALAMVEAQKIAGGTSELAVKQFNAQLINTRALLKQKEQEKILLENHINFIVGRFPQPITNVASLEKLQLPEDVSMGVPSQMLTRRPDIREAEMNLIASNADVAAARAAYLPNLNITAFSGLSSFRWDMMFNPGSLAWGALGNLTAPVFNRNLIKSNHRQSIAEQQAAFWQYQKTILAAYHEVVGSLSQLENFKEIHQLKESEVSELKAAHYISKELFNNGYANYLEVLTAQGTVIQAELDMVFYKKEQFKTLVDLYRALGGGR